MHVRRAARSAAVALSTVGLAAAFAATPVVSPHAAAVPTGDVRVNAGSPAGPFSGNKQNEPALAVDALHPNVLAAGSNDEIDLENCQAGADNTCPFTDGVGVSGIYFSFDSGQSWTQPTYSGLSARHCTGAPGDADPGCTARTGPVGTLPNYAENGLVADGDPALAFGPVRKNGRFSWQNGSRLYYATLASNLAGHSVIDGYEAIAVSHTDDVASAAAGNNSAWSKPYVASKQNGAKFSDKEQVWADNAASSKYFGNVYVCYAAFRGNGNGNQPLNVTTSRDGGLTWNDKQVTPAVNNTSSKNGFGRSGCTVRTDSAGKVYVFAYQFAYSATAAAQGLIQVITSSDGGATWSRPQPVVRAYDSCDYTEASIGRCVMDGVGGARSDLSPAPSVDISNGAPYGTDATNRIVLSWVDGQELNHETVMFSSLAYGSSTWTQPRAVQRSGDRGYYSAPAISPNGQDVYLVYNAWRTPFRDTAEGPSGVADRQLVGVVLHADVTSAGVGTFSQIHRGATGDARGSSQNSLSAEFLGDYVYAAATRTYGAGVWNDVRNASHCDAVDEYRQELHEEAVATGVQTAEAEEPRGEMAGDSEPDADAADAPAVQVQCPASFGNSDIYGGSWADPTP